MSEIWPYIKEQRMLIRLKCIHWNLWISQETGSRPLVSVTHPPPPCTATYGNLLIIIFNVTHNENRTNQTLKMLAKIIDKKETFINSWVKIFVCLHSISTVRISVDNSIIDDLVYLYLLRMNLLHLLVYVPARPCDTVWQGTFHT